MLVIFDFFYLNSSESIFRAKPDVYHLTMLVLFLDRSRSISPELKRRWFQSAFLGSVNDDLKPFLGQLWVEREALVCTTSPLSPRRSG